MAIATCLNNLRKYIFLDESKIKQQFVDSGGITNWRVNFKQHKSRGACVIGRASLPSYLLKRIDICKLRLVTQSQ